MVSHNLDRVIDSASHIIYLKDKMEFAGTKEEFCASGYASQFGVGDK
jgi:ABC-type Mn2+/Zn2+ transport system ATPase subunit